jgi:hypothetical protein
VLVLSNSHYSGERRMPDFVIISNFRLFPKQNALIGLAPADLQRLPTANLSWPLSTINWPLPTPNLMCLSYRQRSKTNIEKGPKFNELCSCPNRTECASSFSKWATARDGKQKTAPLSALVKSGKLKRRRTLLSKTPTQFGTFSYHSTYSCIKRYKSSYLNTSRMWF